MSPLKVNRLFTVNKRGRGVVEDGTPANGPLPKIFLKSVEDTYILSTTTEALDANKRSIKGENSS